jgi:hypothetical protein
MGFQEILAWFFESKTIKTISILFLISLHFNTMSAFPFILLPNKSSSFRWIRMTNFINKLNNNQLKNVAKRVDLLNATAQIIESAILIGMYQHHKRVSFARHVLFAFKKVGYDFGRVRHQKIKILINGKYGHDGIASHIIVFVFQA